jgi:hypothetical protein
MDYLYEFEQVEVDEDGKAEVKIVDGGEIKRLVKLLNYSKS